MKILLYILSIAVICFGGFLTVGNRTKFLNEQALFEETKRAKEKKEEENTVMVGLRDTLEQDAKDTQNQINESDAEIGLVEPELANIEKSIKETEAKILESETELKTYEDLITGIEEVFEERVDIDEVPEKIKELQTENAEKVDAYNSLVIVNDKLTEKVAKENLEKKKIDANLASIKTRVAYNALTATITSVNSDWGFVIINAGTENSTIEPNTELVVKRGSQYLGKIKVAQVEANKTICDIDGSGIGSLLRAGDKVILNKAVVK